MLPRAHQQLTLELQDAEVIAARRQSYGGEARAGDRRLPTLLVAGKATGADVMWAVHLVVHVQRHIEGL
jgi:hypothetical protein